MRHTLLLLMSRPKASLARFVRSAIDCRLRGNFVWATVSQAIACTRARSSGGKSRLAAASCFVLDGKSAGASVALGELTDQPFALPLRRSSRDDRTATTPSASVAHPERRRCGGEPSHVPLAKNTLERYKGSVWVHARAASLPA